MAASTAHASRVEPPPPLLEAIVRGEPLPPHVQTASGRHVLDEEDRSSLRALARAHAEGNAPPFRAALASNEAWLVHVALESLTATRIGARRSDEEFVASFLPELDRLAKHAEHRELALEALAALAVTAHAGDARMRAQQTLVDAVVAAGDTPSLRVLARAVEDDPHLPIPRPQRDVLVRRFLERLRTSTPEERFGVGVEWRLAATVAEPDLVAGVRAIVEEARATRPGAADHWLPFLATVGHPDTPALVREVLARGLRYRGGSFMSGVDAAAIRPDPSYVPYFQSNQNGGWINWRYTDAVAAIDDPSARALLRTWATSDAGMVDGERSPAARWLAVDPAAASAWLLEVARGRDAERRAVALRFLAEAGRTDVLDAILQEAASARRPTGFDRVRYEVLFGLAAIVRKAEDPALRGKALTLVRGPSREEIALLEAAYAGEPEAAETRLLAMLAQLAAAPQWDHVYVIEGLGRVGGARSLKALAPWTGWREPGDPDVFDLHLIARAAIGLIEQRLGR